MLQVFTIIAPLFLIIFVSAILQYYKKIGENWSVVLNDFALKIGLPVLVFSALSKVPFNFLEQSGFIIVNSIFILLGLFLIFVVGKILKFKKQTFLTLFICFVFGNTAYLGIPVLVQTAGESILPTATLIVAIQLFWLFTVGLTYLEYSMDKNKKVVIKNILKNIFTNPLLVAVILGIIVGSLKISLPSVLLKALEMITASVTPTVLIVIGLFIGKSKIGNLVEWFPVFLFSIVKVAILPAAVYFGANFFELTSSQFSSSVIQAAMPLAITPFALADKYNLDKNFMACSIVLGTILSIISLPIWISLL